MQGEYGIYISDNSSLKAQGLQNIEKAITTSKEKLKVNGEIPQVTVLTQEEMGDGVFASYNAVKNHIYLSDTVGNKAKTIELQKRFGYADPGDPTSTVRHEMIHWQDAMKYEIENGDITKDNYENYLEKLREDSKIELDARGVTAESSSNISEYAGDSYAVGFYDEVLTELRVIETGKH